VLVPLKAQRFVGPEIATGVVGADLFTEMLLCTVEPHPLTFTLTLPLLKEEENRKLIEAVP
jgi:hypothetical protein